MSWFAFEIDWLVVGRYKFEFVGITAEVNVYLVEDIELFEFRSVFNGFGI